MDALTDTEKQQSLFDRAVEGLAGQGFRKSFGPGRGLTACKYRTGGLKCAIGHLIPDSKYNPVFEVMGLAGVLEDAPDIAAPIDSPTWCWFKSLQAAHDTADSPGDMRRRLTNFAQKRNLALPLSLTSTENI